MCSTLNSVIVFSLRITQRVFIQTTWMTCAIRLLLSKKALCDLFGFHCDHGENTLKFHLLDHLVENAEPSGTIHVLSASIYEHCKFLVKQAHDSTSIRLQTRTTETITKKNHHSSSNNSRNKSPRFHSTGCLRINGQTKIIDITAIIITVIMTINSGRISNKIGNNCFALLSAREPCFYFRKLGVVPTFLTLHLIIYHVLLVVRLCG